MNMNIFIKKMGQIKDEAGGAILVTQILDLSKSKHTLGKILLK